VKKDDPAANVMDNAADDNGQDESGSSEGSAGKTLHTQFSFFYPIKFTSEWFGLRKFFKQHLAFSRSTTDKSPF